jgi:tRNA(His) guanylyltransferase
VNGEEFEKRMRGGEAFSGLTVLDGMYIVVRVDGRSFTKYTERARYTKPFDENFSLRMVTAMRRLMVELGAVYGHTHSDEISVLLKPSFDLFNRRPEKLVSVSAGITSASFGECFDARLWLGVDLDRVIDYFSWRQADAASNGLASWAYWSLRKAGLSAANATSALRGADDAQKNEVLHGLGINFNDTPLWTRRGTAARWARIQREGFNPVTKETTTAERTVLELEAELPMRDQYRDWLKEYLLKELSE